MKFKNLSLLLAALLLVSGINPAFSQFKKDFHKDFQVKEGMTLKLENKFGDIKLENWTKNEVVIDIEIIVDTKHESKADKVFSNIEISFIDEASTIGAKTKTIGNFNNIEFEINYHVKLPVYMKLDVFNKFGSVSIDEIHGKSKIDIEYGNLTANKLLFDDSKPLSEINLAYSNADIELVNWLNLKAKYSNIDIDESRALILYSRYSTIKLNKNNSTVTDSKYDTYEINKSKNFVFSGQFSDVEISEINQKLDLKIKYGNFEVDDISAEFEEIKLENKYANVELDIDDNASYQIDAFVEYANLDLPDSKHVKVSEDGAKASYSGTIGKDTNTSKKVIVRSKYGNVEL